MSSNEESRSPTSSIRGGSTGSMRGRGGGGFVPKKKLLAQMQSMELSSSDSSNVANNKEKFKIPAAAEDSDESETTDSESEQTKRCDFCGDMTHQNRSCPLLQLQNNPLCQDEPEKMANNSNTCYHCKQEGHFKADCPKLGVLLKNCYYCKKEGHLKSECPEKAAREAKKRERELTLNYTFRKNSTHKETPTSPTLSTTTAVDVFYEGPTAKEKEEENEAAAVESKEEEAPAPPRVIVPFPVKASQLKSEIKLRAKLGSTGSDQSAPSKNVVRSESSEEEDRESVESDNNDESKENNPLAKDQQKMDETAPKANGEEEFQTIGIKVDGCVEFDSGDDRSYYDCSDGEKPNADGILEEPDELYGEDGALIYDEEEPTKMEEDGKNNDEDEGNKEEKEQIVGKE